MATSLALNTGYLGKHQPDVDVRLYTNSGTVLPDQRIALARMALEQGADWTVWIDDDMRFPKDAIERLLAHRKPIVGANYPTRRWPAIEPVTFKDEATTERVYTSSNSAGLESVASIGLGCAVVHRSVYDAIMAPWFFYEWDEVGCKYDGYEDAYFCRKARKAGFDVLIDHDVSKEVAHVGQMEYTILAADAMRERVHILRPQLVQNHIKTA